MVVPVFFYSAILLHPADFLCVCVDYIMTMSVSEVIEALVRDK